MGLIMTLFLDMFYHETDCRFVQTVTSYPDNSTTVTQPDELHVTEYFLAFFNLITGVLAIQCVVFECLLIS